MMINHQSNAKTPPKIADARQAFRRHREMREAAAADAGLSAFIRANPGAGGRARLAALKAWIAASKYPADGLMVRYKHADAVWTLVLGGADHD